MALILGEGVTLNVYGTLSVGGIVGYKQSARPYQGQTSADYAILRLDGALNVQSGGVLDVNGYIVGGGKTDVLAGGASKLPFIVKDYKGGSNSQNVYNAGFVPLNIYEMPNIQTNYTIRYGAQRIRYAVVSLWADIMWRSMRHRRGRHDPPRDRRLRREKDDAH